MQDKKIYIYFWCNWKARRPASRHSQMHSWCLEPWWHLWVWFCRRFLFSENISVLPVNVFFCLTYDQRDQIKMLPGISEWRGGLQVSCSARHLKQDTGDSDGTVRYGRVLPMSGTDGTHNKKAVMCTVNKDLEKIEGKFWRFIFDTENSLARKNSQHKIDLLIVFEAHH